MKFNFNTALDAFFSGVLLEHILLVGASPVLLIILIVFVTSVIIDLKIDYDTKTLEPIDISNKELLEGWIVHSSGQNIANLTWNIHAIYLSYMFDYNSAKVKEVFVEGADSYEDAIKQINYKIKFGNVKNI